MSNTLVVPLRRPTWNMHFSVGVALTAAVCGAVATPAAAEADTAFHSIDAQLQALVHTVAELNPELRAAQSRARAQFEGVGQVSALPDPMLRLRYFAETPETRVGPQQQSLELSQALPWAGKRQLQGQRQNHFARSADWETDSLQRRIVAELKRAYYESAYLQEALVLNREEQELLRRFETIALRRYSTGQGTQQNVVRIQTDITLLDEREIQLLQELQRQSSRIDELVGGQTGELQLAPIALDLSDVPLDRAGIDTMLRLQHPQIRAIQERVQAEQMGVRRHELERRPDFQVGLGLIRVGSREDLAGRTNPPGDNGKDVLSFSVGINLPVYRKRIHSGIARAREAQRAEQQSVHAVRQRLRHDGEDARLRAESARTRGELVRDVIIPQAEESLASAEAAYTTNRLGFLDLIEAQRLLFETRHRYRRLLSDHWIALADLELALGLPFPPRTEAGMSDE